MIGGPVALATFLSLVLVLLALPLLPAWQEWRRPSDAQALSVPPDARHAHYFADVLRRAVLLDRAMRALLSPPSFDHLRVPVDQINWRAARRPIISSLSIRIRDAIRCTQPLYVRRNLDVDAGSHFDAVLVDGHMWLGPQCRILHWAHADGAFKVGSHCIAVGRLSSQTRIDLDDGCLFERINAPTICFGSALSGDPDSSSPYAAGPPRRADFADLPNATQRTPAMHRVDGDCELPPGRLYVGSLVVTGRLRVGENTIILGDVKARKGLHIGRHASVEGAVVCEQTIDILAGARLRGPVLAERAVTLGVGVRIGEPSQQTTLSAATVLAEASSTVHGTVWAREAGLVWAG